jgi:hypothetical protein
MFARTRISPSGGLPPRELGHAAHYDGAKLKCKFSVHFNELEYRAKSHALSYLL